MSGNNVILLPNSLRDPYSFEDVINIQEKIDEGVNELDLSRITFIEPYSMLSLLLLGRNYLRSSGNKLKLVKIPINIHQYLNRMDFFKTGVFEVTDTLNEKLLLKRSSISSRIIEISEIPNKERESVKVISNIATIFRKRAAHILKYWFSDKITDYFITVISEVCQNIYEHSLDSGYLAMQTYSVGKENIVRLVISDSGIGIKQSFEKNAAIKYESVAKLIEMSITTPISSKREFGYGLCEVNYIVEKLNGILFIRSGNASLTVPYNKGSRSSSFMFLKNDLNYFNGMQISISLSS